MGAREKDEEKLRSLESELGGLDTKITQTEDFLGGLKTQRRSIAEQIEELRRSLGST